MMMDTRGILSLLILHLLLLVCTPSSEIHVKAQAELERDEVWSRYAGGRSCTLNSTLESSRHAQTAWEMGILATLSYVEWANEKYQIWPGADFQMNVLGCRKVKDSWQEQTLEKVRTTKRLMNLSIFKIFSSLDHIYRWTLEPFTRFVSMLIPRRWRTSHVKDRGMNRKSTLQLMLKHHMVASGCSKESFKLRWFLSNWHENGWHDTEVLLAETKETAVIAFRGTESTADMITNSQAYESVRHSRYFNGIDYGAVHRGFMNAYSRVDKGDITALNSQHAGYDTFGDAIPRVYNECMKARHRNVNSTATGPQAAFTCAVRGIRLAGLLVDSAFSALKKGKNVVITGHSLGAALSFLLTLDMIVNFPVPYPYTVGNFSRVPKSIMAKRNREKGKSKRAKLLENMYLYNFGEPEFADEIFFHSIVNSTQIGVEFYGERYSKFISLTKSPQCKTDMVTRLTSKIESYTNYLGLYSGRRKLKHAKHLKDQYKHSLLQMGEKLNLPFGLFGYKDLGSSSKTIYLCSGSANSSMEAHGMQHYLRGIAYAARSMSTRKEEYRNSNLLNDGSSSGAVNLLDNAHVDDNVNRTRGGFHQKNTNEIKREDSDENVELYFDLDQETASTVGLVPTDGCFVTRDDGYATYAC